MSITVNLNNANGTGTTYSTAPTPMYLFPQATLSANVLDSNSIDTISVQIATHTSTMTLGLDPAAQTLAASKGITASYDANTGLLTLTGGDERTSDWQSILRGITFTDSSDTPVDPGSVTVTAKNTGHFGGTGTDAQTLHLDVAPVNLFSNTHTNADDFAGGGYGANSGTENWAGNWTESGEQTSTTGGWIQVSGGELRFGDDSNGGGSSTHSIARQVASSLADAVKANLSFDYNSNTSSSDEKITVEIYNGTKWTTLGAFGANGADGSFSADISAYISGGTSVRFSVPSSLDKGEFIYIDNVKVSYDVPSSSSLPTQALNWESNPHILFSSANGNAIWVSDANDANLTVTLHVGSGTLTLGSVDGLTVTGNGTGTVVLSGAIANINTALQGLDYLTTSQDTTVGDVDDVLTITTSDGHTGGTDTDTVNIDVYCFYPGTMIRTPDGEVAVETLTRGDRVLTADGRAMPVTWIGLQTISTRFADPLRVLPIRVKAGALGDNLPVRDLLLSPDHALLVGGSLIQAGALVNGTSIVRETGVPQVFTYYHVELDDHSLILAEGVPAETFVDNVDRLAFDNWSEHQALYPNGKAISELPYPRAKAHRQVPVGVRVMLAERARAIGAAMDAVA
ncbi:Hint domain-containing protein [Blastochloris tepida]|uniref:Hedgehog/Intein (Hint) domain-containing protein n=1 Tax=Blastochloris tepida TaxID=2233851 RepID=A0A348G2L1_9HYPH|nr:Hint domain-containing protein [Blastochloris tepida]BBF93794.1 hypothetical protein BLTE_24790 [Blastochloris tepida]